MDEYSRKLDEMDNIIKKALPEGEKLRVVYSAYETSDATQNPLNNLNRRAIDGKVVLVHAHDEFWGEGADFQSEVLENPTWLDIAVVANEMIKVTGDYHHIFLEGVYAKKNKKIDGVKVYEFAMGS